MDSETTTGRRGVNEKDVWKAADALLVEGRRPTIEAVRLKIGRGSPNTITPYLDTWFKGLGKRLQDPGAFAAPTNVPEPIAAAATHFWEAALAAARQEIGVERSALEVDRAALEAERQEMASQRAAFAASEKALQDALQLAKDQLAEADRRAQMLEERAATFEADARRLAAEARTQREARESERLAAAEEGKRRDQERKEESVRFEATEKRWLADVDQARQSARAVTAQLDKVNATLAEERALRAGERNDSLVRERELALAVAAADRKATAALSEAKSTRVLLDDASATVAELEETLKVSAEEHEAEILRLHDQLDSALQAVGRALPRTVAAAAAEARQ